MNEFDKKNFGFEEVTSGQKRTLVDSVFSDVAGKYDLMNDLMSVGVHRLWKDKFCSMIPNLDSRIIDVAGGTGDISFRIMNNADKMGKNPHITVCDINKDMLKLCREKAINNNIVNKFEVLAGDAENLPFRDNSFDYYTIAFGIRNMLSIQNTLKEAYRVLKPTGKFLCLEFSKVQNAVISPLYDLYSFKFIPWIGNKVAGNREAYKYLAESISLFPDQEEFKTMIHEAGFSNVGYENLTFGIAAIHYGFK
jgi:demethylmenaquinone methyltransferase/2-methoxy-6-polyprenyl-1,4-benzoquinol methylase